MIPASRGLSLSRSIIFRTALALSGGLSTSVASAQSFEGLGFLSPGVESYGRGLSDNGVVVGMANPGGGGYNRAVYWVNGVMQAPLDLGAASASVARAVNADGSVIVGFNGYLSYSHPFRWTNGVMTELALLPGGTTAYAFGVSDNGNVVVGYGDLITYSTFEHAVRWSGGVTTDLGTLNGGYFSKAFGVSGDGNVVVGTSQKSSNFVAFRWTAATGMVNIGTLKANRPAEAWATNSNGSVVVGYGETTSGDRAFRWIGGTMTNLGTVSGVANSYASAINGSGSRVVGFASQQAGSPSRRSVPPPTTDRAFLWDSALGMKDLRTYLLTLPNIDLTGWTLTGASGITTDGNTIVGNGWHNGQPEAWVARLVP